MYKLAFKREILRKLIHLSTLFFPLFLYCYGKQKCLPYFLLCGILFISFDICRQKSNLIKSIYNYFFSTITRNHEDKGLTGASYVFLSVILITFIFDKNIAIVSLLIMIFPDASASLFGRYFGNFKIYDKSLEGSLVFFIVSCIILIFFSFPYLESIVVALFCTTVELLSNKIKIDDNFLIPFTASVTIFFLQYI